MTNLLSFLFPSSKRPHYASQRSVCLYVSLSITYLFRNSKTKICRKSKIDTKVVTYNSRTCFEASERSKVKVTRPHNRTWSVFDPLLALATLSLSTLFIAYILLSKIADRCFQHGSLYLGTNFSTHYVTWTIIWIDITQLRTWWEPEI